MVRIIPRSGKILNTYLKRFYLYLSQINYRKVFWSPDCPLSTTLPLSRELLLQSEIETSVLSFIYLDISEQDMDESKYLFYLLVSLSPAPAQAQPLGQA